MAGYTLSFFQCRMNPGLIQIQVLNFMAHVTDIVPFLLEQQFRDNAMRQMALFTFLFLDHGMDIFLRQVLFYEILVAVHTLFPLELPFPAAKLPLSSGGGRKCQKQNGTDKDHYSNHTRSLLIT